MTNCAWLVASQVRLGRGSSKEQRQALRERGAQASDGTRIILCSIIDDNRPDEDAAVALSRWLQAAAAGEAADEAGGAVG